MLNSKLLILKFQKISRINKNRENIPEKVLKYHTNSQNQISKEM